MSDDPWQDIVTPATFDAIRAKRVDPENPWNFFWGRAPDRRCVLVLAHTTDPIPQRRLPHLRGLEIIDTGRGTGADRVLMFKLIEDGQRDIFYRLCRDIVASASRAASENESVALTLARTFRWHHLLRGGQDGRMSAEAQKGLVAELLVIERYLLGVLSARDAVRSWRGPTGSPKDFEVGRICIEAKARRGAATPHIAISSADQLDTAGVDALFLFVAEVDEAPEASISSFTLPEFVSRLRERLLAMDASVETEFEGLLLAAGFDHADDYSDFRWVLGPTVLFRVEDDFPRISASALPSGIARVTYTVALQDCAPHEVQADVIIGALATGQHGS